MPVEQEPQVMTANRLGDGAVVYLTESGGWSEWLHEARVAETDADETALTDAAAAAEAARLVVSTYAMRVARDEVGRPLPLSQRERIRAAGPTVHPAFGKQAYSEEERG